MKATIQQLPREIYCEIFSFLPFDSLVAVELVNHEFHDTTSNAPFLWRNLCEKDWTLVGSNTSEQTTDATSNDNKSCSEIEVVGDWKQVYAQRHTRYDRWESSLRYNSDFQYVMTKKKMHEQSAATANETRNPFQSDLTVLGNEIKFILSFPILYLKLLWFFFVVPYKQPAYMRIHEAEFIKKRALTAGTWLLNTLCFAPILIATYTLHGNVVTSIAKVYLLAAYFVTGVSGHFERPIDINNLSDRLLCLFTSLTGVFTLVLSLYRDDIILSSVTIIQLSIALGLANSFKMVIYNETSVPNFFVPTGLPVNILYKAMHGKPLVTNMILTNIAAVILTIGGLKVIVIVLIVAIFIFTGSGSLKLSSDFFSLKIFVVIAAGIFSSLLYNLSLRSLGGNYRVRSKTMHVSSRFLLIILSLSYFVLVYRVFTMGLFKSDTWELSSLDEFIAEKLAKLSNSGDTTPSTDPSL